MPALTRLRGVRPLRRRWLRYPGTAPFRLHHPEQAALARPEPGDQLLPRGELAAWEPELAQARADVRRQVDVVGPVGPGDLRKHLSKLGQHPLVFAHVSRKRFSGFGY